MNNTLKQGALAVAVIFGLWNISDVLFHGMILAPDYVANPQLWRPVDDMKEGLMFLSRLLTAVIFVVGYHKVVRQKSKEAGVTFGLFSGLLIGIGMSLDSYASTPISGKIALVWCLLPVINFLIAGAVVGKTLQDPQ